MCYQEERSSFQNIYRIRNREANQIRADDIHTLRNAAGTPEGKEDEVWEMKEQNKARSLEDGEPGGARVGTQAMDALPPVTGGQT